MSKNIIEIVDFNLFNEALKAMSKVVEATKFSISETGVEVYAYRDKVCKIEMLSNAIKSQTPIEFCVADVALLSRVAQSIKDVQGNDYVNAELSIDGSFLKFKSKKFKTKLTICDEDRISKWLSTKISSTLVSEFAFTTSSAYIKSVCSHSYIYPDANSLRIYLSTQDDMENNAVFATLGNKETLLNNEMILKFGIVTSGKISEGRSIILDLERLNMFNAMPVENIEMFLPEKINVLVSKVKLNGTNDTYLDFNVYNSLMKK